MLLGTEKSHSSRRGPGHWERDRHRLAPGRGGGRHHRHPGAEGRRSRRGDPREDGREDEVSPVGCDGRERSPHRRRGRSSSEFGRIDILVNNAGVQDWVPFLETSEEMWDRHQAVNVRGRSCSRRPWHGSWSGKSGGKIINIASDSGVAPTPEGAAAYCTSKSAIIGLTRVIAKELGRMGSTATRSVPAPSIPPMTGAIPQDDPQKENSLDAWAEHGGLEADRASPRISAASPCSSPAIYPTSSPASTFSSPAATS